MPPIQEFASSSLSSGGNTSFGFDWPVFMSSAAQVGANRANLPRKILEVWCENSLAERDVADESATWRGPTPSLSATVIPTSSGSVILSGAMMFEYLGWEKAAELIHKGLEGAIANKRVTYDFARLMEGATEIKCSEFADEIIRNF